MSDVESFSSTVKNSLESIFKPGIELCLIFGVLVFLADVVIPSRLIISLLYIPVVGMACRLSSRKAAFMLITTASVLTLLGLVLSASGNDMLADFFNRLFVIVAMWAIGLFAFWGRREDARGTVGWKARKGPSQSSLGSHHKHNDQSEFPSNEHTLTVLNQTLLEKNQELEMLINVVSHDLRSPLVNIQGFSKELSSACERLGSQLELEGRREGDKGEIYEIVEQDIPESLQYIKAAAGKMDAVLSGILRFTRVGRMTLKVEPLDINAMVSVIATAMEFQMKQKSVSLQIHDLPQCVGDETLVSQVFFNLLENAHKYLDASRPGIITVFGSVENDTVVYAVQDNGIGILPEHQGKIFEMFHRLNPKCESGEGLGLTIVKRIVERHQGEMWLESQAGVGTTFFVSFSQSVDMNKKEWQ